MMAAKQSGRRAARTRPVRRRGLFVIVGVLVGLIAGGGLAVAYPPPSTDMIKVQATEWYQHMRQLVATTETAGTRPWVGDPQIYAEAPVALPPEPATDDELLNDDRSEEHTSELQSRFELVCRLLLEKKKEYRKSLFRPGCHHTGTNEERHWAVKQRARPARSRPTRCQPAWCGWGACCCHRAR